MPVQLGRFRLTFSNFIYLSMASVILSLLLLNHMKITSVMMRERSKGLKTSKDETDINDLAKQLLNEIKIRERAKSVPRQLNLIDLGPPKFEDSKYTVLSEDFQEKKEVKEIIKEETQTEQKVMASNLPTCTQKRKETLIGHKKPETAPPNSTELQFFLKTYKDTG